MLKIKDDVNLEILGQYKFKEENDNWTYWRGVRRIIIYKKDRRIAYNGMSNDEYDILFDLINAGIVEKTDYRWYKKEYKTKNEYERIIKELEEKIRILTKER